LDESPNRLFEPFVYQLHGLFRLRENRQVDAIPWFQKTYDSFREHGAIKESTQALIGLADCYQETGNHKAASKTLDIAQQICDGHSLVKYKALVLTLQGLIDQDLGRKTAAEEKLREADNIAKELNDRKLRFQVEFYLYKHALANRKPAVARAIKRRLDKLAVSIPDSVEQLAEFRAIQSRINPE
jgi:tetratricopeptide (TPR) repeat protein